MKRGAVIAIAAGAAALLVGGVAAVWLLSRPPSIEDAARAYLAALSTGDADAIAAMIPDSAPGTVQTTTDAFAGADAYIEDPRVDGVGGDGSVRASATLDGRPATIFFMLSLADGRWQLSGDYLSAVAVTTTIGDAVEVGGAFASTDTALPLLPAVYTVRAAPVGILDGATTVAVTNETPIAVQVEASLSPGANAIAQEQLDAYVEACAAPASAVPDTCGLRIPWGADLASLTAVSFRIEEYPAVALSADAASFAATGGVLVATATGTTRDGAEASFTYRTGEWSLRGVVAFDGDRMVLRVG